MNDYHEKLENEVMEYLENENFPNTLETFKKERKEKFFNVLDFYELEKFLIFYKKYSKDIIGKKKVMNYYEKEIIKMCKNLNNVYKKYKKIKGKVDYFLDKLKYQ